MIKWFATKIPEQFSREISFIEQLDIYLGKDINSYFTWSTKINLKWIITLNIKAKTIKLLYENKRNKLCELGLDKSYLTENTKSIKHKIKFVKLDFIEIKNLYLKKISLRK